MQDLDACPCVRPKATPATSEKSSVLIVMAGAMMLSVAILKLRAPTKGAAAAA
jgi:LPXTG-motif cell wall-anchored protein